MRGGGGYGGALWCWGWYVQVLVATVISLVVQLPSRRLATLIVFWAKGVVGWAVSRVALPGIEHCLDYACGGVTHWWIELGVD